MDYIWILKILSVSIFPILAIWIIFFIYKNNKDYLKFKVWDRDLFFDKQTKKLFYKSMVFSPDLRTFWDMKELYHWEIENINNSEVLYYMYRDVYFDLEEKALLSTNKIRYDITIIVPKVIWWEYNKTYWHFHPKNESWRYFQELYQVLNGEAIYLQQNDNEVFYTKALKWEAVNMEESFWHITINPSENNYIVMANLVDETFSSVYNEYKTNKWWNYFLCIEWWKKNHNYIDKLDLIEKTDKFTVEKSIYDDFLKNPEKFNYLH